MNAWEFAEAVAVPATTVSLFQAIGDFAQDFDCPGCSCRCRLPSPLSILLSLIRSSSDCPERLERSDRRGKAEYCSDRARYRSKRMHAPTPPLTLSLEFASRAMAPAQSDRPAEWRSSICAGRPLVCLESHPALTFVAAMQQFLDLRVCQRNHRRLQCYEVPILTNTRLRWRG
jgi:hypothetical protein